MTDYSQFEAGIKSGIRADSARIQKKDEILAPILKGTRRYFLAGVLLLGATVGLAVVSLCQTGGMPLGSLIGCGLLFLTALFCLWCSFRRKKQIGSDLREYYEEGLLVGGLIVNKEPLTLMALSSLVAYDGGPDRYGCYKLEMRKLEGAKEELYEKIPCSCFFRYESGNYHDSFQPHPLHWGTGDLSAIAQALDKVERESQEEGQDTWGIIRRVAEQFPDLKDGQLVILDENYEPIGIRYYWQTGLDPVKREGTGPDSVKAGHPSVEENRQEKEYYKKPQQAVLNFGDDKPGRDVYERFASLACSHEVYDYISSHCKNGHVENCTHPGFFTCIGDPVKFPQELGEMKLELQMEEYPLFLGRYLATNRGFYRKKEFISWGAAEITVKTDFLDTIKIYVNGKFCTEFQADIQGYENWEQIPEEHKKRIAKMEAKRVEEFLLDIKINGV